ncbi:hypothetical protein DFP72DRAFT_923816 [Ephemerocybe angulata]|uniref:DUF6533 domain-containing protein n=1 Tax=Ephemerocybe angulata TaxID=980116 RepID=A0A8H6HFD4_9AGAR|nr:hypothetical protein DFP72DRAFT_923816 [Tulosesus angulatus]
MSSPEGLSPERAAILVAAVGVNRVVDALVSITIVFFDYFHTFPREVNLMWRSKLTITKALYFVLRYYVMVHSLLWITYHADESLTGTRCNFPFSRNSVSSQVVLVLCEAISYVRVYAFSGRNKYLLIFLVVHYIAVVIITFYYIVKFINSASFLNLPPERGLGCFPSKADGFALTMIVITLIVSLCTASIIMVVIGVRRHRALSTRSNLLKVFYQDGIYYFLCLSAISVTNISIFLLAPANGMQLLIVQPQVHFSALLATRMLLHLREWGAKQQIVIITTDTSYEAFNPHRTETEAKRISQIAS